MERDTNQMSQSAGALCRSGCGFYGSPATDGLCSKCYKDALKRKQSAPNTSLAGRSSSPSRPKEESASANNHPAESFGWNEKLADIGSFRVATTSSGSMSETSLAASTGTSAAVASSSSSLASSPAESALTTASPTVPAAVAIQSPETAKVEGCTSQDSTNEAVSGSSANDNAATSPNPNDQTDDTQQKDQKQKKKNRCLVCRKKVGLTGFECRCGGLFCSIHRYSNEHNCTFDYKELGAQEIRKNNPLVVGEKIQKI